MTSRPRQIVFWLLVTRHSGTRPAPGFSARPPSIQAFCARTASFPQRTLNALARGLPRQRLRSQSRRPAEMLQEPLSVSGGSRYIPSQVGSHISISSTMAITRANTSLGHSDTACLLDLGECWPSAPSALLSIAATLTCPMPDRPSLRAGIARRPPKHDAVMSSLAHARHTEPATTPAPDSLERGVNAVEVVAHAGPTLETVSCDDHTSDVARQRTSGSSGSSAVWWHRSQSMPSDRPNQSRLSLCPRPERTSERRPHQVRAVVLLALLHDVRTSATPGSPLRG